ncbi:PREDICTED: adenosine kinase 2-like [Nicrophorus vespilloides]|uniref:Adenosine kinase n=1 Tax=Nicrophorus vespilloides TaxID=110193 RepID=A0ABM1M0W0_NICVS|nr:PREDICTED: adenosine kinase 2-like [Nicrophorus vespilloides]
MTPGGCTQNTLRILHWLSKGDITTYMFGAIGNDSNGKFLKTEVEKANVQTRYATKPLATGLMISLVFNQHRSLAGNIGASELYTEADLKHADNMTILSSVGLIYMEGFFITNRLPVAKNIMTFCKKNKKSFAFNLCASYLVESYKDAVKEFVEASDILFGNLDEFECLMKNNGKNDFVSYAKELVNGTSKMVVITNGSEKVQCVEASRATEFQVPTLQNSKVVDTTGAGDSFVSGFLYGYMQKKDMLTCVKWGCQTAQQVIQYIGVQLPKEVFAFDK